MSMEELGTTPAIDAVDRKETTRKRLQIKVKLDSSMVA